MLDTTNVGRFLRRQREQEAGPYQGPLRVNARTVALCVGLGSIADNLATELLVRILREQQIDARHLFREELQAPMPADAPLDGVSTVLIVSAYPSEERMRVDDVATLARSTFSASRLVTLFLPGPLLQSNPFEMKSPADEDAASFGEAVQICLDIQKTSSAAPTG